jgi:hypothetical protein
MVSSLEIRTMGGLSGFSGSSQLYHSATSHKYLMLFLMRQESLNSITRREKRSMSNKLKNREQTQAPAIQAPLVKEVSRLPSGVRERVGVPKVLIRGDIRLRVPEFSATSRPVKGHYHIETEGMHEPLQVIWIIEGNVLNHTVRSIVVEFDVRGIPAGETLTQVLTAQVTDKNGQGCIVHSSVFIQIFVMRDDLRKSDLALNTISL